MTMPAPPRAGLPETAVADEKLTVLAWNEEARRLYRGDLLEEELSADWCAEERERLRELYLEPLARMGECYGARGDYARAAHRLVSRCQEEKKMVGAGGIEPPTPTMST